MQQVSTRSRSQHGDKRRTRMLLIGLFVSALIYWSVRHNVVHRLLAGGRAFVRDKIYDLRLALVVPAKNISSLRSGAPHDKQIYLDTAGQTVKFASNGLTLAGTLYRPDASGRCPAILLLHGSTPEGRKLGMYRVMGRDLARRGYIVLCIDLRGWGDSDDPATVAHPADLDFPADVQNAVTFLRDLPGVDDSQIFLVGHSFGGDVAVTAGPRDPRIAKIVAIGPGRRYHQRAERELDYFRRRAMRYMHLPRPIPTAVFRQTCAALPLENHMEHYCADGHKPLLLIDGALESSADQAFLREAYTAIAAPKAYRTVPDADHYANVANVGPVVVYDRRVVATLIATIDMWLQDMWPQLQED